MDPVTARLVQGVRARLILSAKVIINDHWPRDDGCPICGVHMCRARSTAYAYLHEVGEPLYVPPARPSP